MTLLTMLLTTATAWAQPEERQLCVVIHEAASTTAFALETRPVVSFADSDVKLECNDVTILYPLDNYLKMTIEESTLPTDVKTVADDQSSWFNVTSSNITATGCASLSIYAVDGKCLATERADADGVVTLNISQLRAGTYIAVAETKTFKFNKR